jgi:hypothetical protein
MITFIICGVFTFLAIYVIDVVIKDFEPFRSILVYLVGLITALIFYHKEIYVEPVTFLKETRILQHK